MSISAIITAMMDSERPYVTSALDSVQQQNVRPDETSIYVSVNNNWIDDLVSNRAGVSIKRVPHANVSEVRNLAAQQAHSEWIAYLDADDVWCKNKLGRQMEAVGQNSDLGLVLCDYWYIDQHGACFGIGRCITINPSCWLIRRSVMLEHPFDHKYATGQDVEWVLRVLGRIRHHRVAEPLSCYRVRPDSIKSKLNIPRKMGSDSARKQAPVPRNAGSLSFGFCSETLASLLPS